MALRDYYGDAIDFEDVKVDKKLVAESKEFEKTHGLEVAKTWNLTSFDHSIEHFTKDARRRQEENSLINSLFGSD